MGTLGHKVFTPIDFVKFCGNFKILRWFHDYLQSVAHYTLDEENSERLMLKYYEKIVTKVNCNNI